MTHELYRAIVQAEKASSYAMKLAYEEPKAPFLVRRSLGKSQSILMHYVVKHAHEHYQELWP